MKRPRRIVATRWAIVDLPTRLTPEPRLRWSTTYPRNEDGPELWRTRREARAIAAAHNANPAWGWRQRVARVRVTIEEA